jgi:hypothetical protein
LKKQEEKRQRRFGIKQEGEVAAEGEVTEGESEITETGGDESEGGHLGDKASEDGQSETKQKPE